MDAYFLSISYFVEDRHLMQLLFKTEITFQLYIHCDGESMLLYPQGESRLSSGDELMN